VNVKSLLGDTPVGTHLFPVVVAEQSTPKRKVPKPSSIGPEVGAVIGPVKPVELTPARLNAMV
jgi:hypothetical protein